MTAPAIGAMVQLKPIEIGNAGAMYRWMLDPEVSVNVGLRSVPSLVRTEEWIARALQDRAFLPLGIYWMDRHVGNVIFDRIDAGAARLSIYVGEPDTRGKGIGTMALEVALNDAFTSGRFETVWLTVHHSNTRAHHIYEKLGFRNVGEALEEAIPSTRMELSRTEWIREAR